MAVVYKHIRNIDNVCFYIGIGNNIKRAYIKSKRSIFWQNEINKYNYRVEIHTDNLTFKEAKIIEIELIKQYGRRDLGLGTLVNLTDGGDGAIGKITSDETKLKLSKSMIGKNINKIHSKETKLKMSLNGKGKNKGSNNGMYENTKYRRGNSNCAKKIINTNTLEVYDCLLDVCDILNMKKSTLAAKLNGQNKNTTVFKYV